MLSSQAAGNLSVEVYICPAFEGVFCSPATTGQLVGSSTCDDAPLYCNSNIHGQGVVERDVGTSNSPCSTSADCNAMQFCNEYDYGEPAYCTEFEVPTCFPD